MFTIRFVAFFHFDFSFSNMAYSVNQLPSPPLPSTLPFPSTLPYCITRELSRSTQGPRANFQDPLKIRTRIFKIHSRSTREFQDPLKFHARSIKIHSRSMSEFPRSTQDPMPELRVPSTTFQDPLKFHCLRCKCHPPHFKIHSRSSQYPHGQDPLKIHA